MADQIFNVECGFFDSVNQDRLYTADQMNLPYKRIVANGVFATQQGTPSDDLQVVSANNGMQIIVKKGQGLFADKWFENLENIYITVPDNTNINPRRDSVIAQVDKRLSGRVGNIIYRTGTPSASAPPPEINTEADVIEYRIANILVGATVHVLTDRYITDLRGSAECPWITSLIQQVDTSTLFNQWQSAYEQYYDQSKEDFDEFTEEQKEAWDQFFNNLTSELTVASNVIMLQSSFTSYGSEIAVPINIPSYNYRTDVLLVFINGLLAQRGVKYDLSANKKSIILANPITSGQIVYFVVFHSVIAANIETTVSMIQNLETEVGHLTDDTGWIDLTLVNDVEAADSYSTPAYRRIGNNVYLRGAVSNISATGTTVATLPVALRPAMAVNVTSLSTFSDSVINNVLIQIATNGDIKIQAKNGDFGTSYRIPIDATYVLG